MNTQQRRKAHQERVARRERLRIAERIGAMALYLVLSFSEYPRPLDPIADTLLTCGVNILNKLSDELDRRAVSENTLREVVSLMSEADSVINKYGVAYGYYSNLKKLYEKQG